MELYWGSGSSNAWRVMLGLLFKGMPYQSQLLSFSDREHKSAHYTRLNPRGQVPTLVDGEVVVTESVAILAYLDRVYPRRMLFGASAAASGSIWPDVMEINQYLEPKAMNVVRALFLGTWKGRVKELRETMDTVFDELDQLERTVDEGPFTARDCMLVPMLETLLRSSLRAGAAEIGMLPFDTTRWPRLFARLDAVRAVDGYRDTFPPHWK